MARLSSWAAILVPLLVALPLIVGLPIVGVPLRDIGVLTFESGEYAYRMHSPSLPKLQCVGLHCGYDADRLHMAQCTNSGLNDEYEVEWACTAMVNAGYELDGAKVLCEGFSGPGDAYITPGSCVLEYSLKRVYESQPLRLPEERNFWSPATAQDEFLTVVCIIALMAATTMCFMLIINPYISSLVHSTPASSRPHTEAPQSAPSEGTHTSKTFSKSTTL